MTGRFLIYSTFVLIMLFLACDEPDVIPEVNFIGKAYDMDLVDKWTRSYSRRDQYNGITLYSDTLVFNHKNAGTWRVYAFGQLSSDISFNFYSSQDTLHLYINKKMLSYKYFLRSDSLFLISFIPDSLSYLDEKYFTQGYIKSKE